ncbi:MAG TPA: hypothetical protein VM537_17085 [Anaerolineae bacterium]|nr:hypothetical protein [Anaerolineae bacterium]
MKKLYRDEAWLKKKYWEEELTLCEMAELARCSKNTIRNHMVRYGILRRSGPEIYRITYDPTTSAGRARKQKRSKANKKAYDPTTSAGRALRQTQSETNKAVFDSATSKGRELRRRASEFQKAFYDPTTSAGRMHRQKQSETSKAAWARGAFDGEACRQKMSEASKAAWARGAMDGALPLATSIEIAVSVALDILGIEHEPQYRPDGHSRVYDEFVPLDVLIEVHGDYWHSSDEAQERDAEKAAWARDNGYHLVVIWEHEIDEVGALDLVSERVFPLLEGAG